MLARLAHCALLLQGSDRLCQPCTLFSLPWIQPVIRVPKWGRTCVIFIPECSVRGLVLVYPLSASMAARRVRYSTRYVEGP